MRLGSVNNYEILLAEIAFAGMYLHGILRLISIQQTTEELLYTVQYAELQYLYY